MRAYANITRRNFLRTLVALCALVLLHPARALAKCRAPRTHDSLTTSLATFFSHKESAKFIGLEYLRHVPEEADVQRLVGLLCSGQGDRQSEFIHATPGKLRELLLLQQRQDFKHGRIANVKGWILSETEVRLCAMAALV